MITHNNVIKTKSEKKVKNFEGIFDVTCARNLIQTWFWAGWFKFSKAA